MIADFDPGIAVAQQAEEAAWALADEAVTTASADAAAMAVPGILRALSLITDAALRDAALGGLLDYLAPTAADMDLTRLLDAIADDADAAATAHRLAAQRHGSGDEAAAAGFTQYAQQRHNDAA
jgi:hypothetical protein